MKKMGIRSFFLFSVLVLFLSVFCVAGDGTVNAKECSNDLQKLMTCLNFATGKANTPGKDCCTSVKDIKDSDPKCLCYIIQQTNNASSSIKSLGVQQAKLLLLPSVCQLQNASVSNCPSLLGLSPSSPDAAIFSNASSTPAASTNTISSPDKSDGKNHRPYLTGPLVIAMAIFFNAFPTLSTSMQPLCMAQLN